MTAQEKALEHLQVIRALMERSQVYRSISAPAALCGGLLALAASAVELRDYAERATLPTHGDRFLLIWLGILIVTSVVNAALLARDAARRGQPWISDGMRTALRAFMPPMLAGGVLGIGLVRGLENLTLASLIWIICYGLALLSTASFSPRSLIRLGWAFLVAGMILFYLWTLRQDLRSIPNDAIPATACLGLTFGVFHIIYALAVFLHRGPRPSRSTDA